LFVYAQELFRDEQKLLMSGDNLENLMTEAGFVDLKVDKYKIEIGDWGPGLFPTSASFSM